MTTVNEALNNVRAQVGSGISVGNGECYALASWYERMISPDATVGLGAGVGWVSGAIGDTISAKNIGSSYNWQANGWTVSTSGPFKAGQIVTLGATPGNPYGHVVIVEAVDGDRLTI
ncbi:TPA: PlySs2 family phage lysin, partial [Streptococcus suis]